MPPYQQTEQYVPNIMSMARGRFSQAGTVTGFAQADASGGAAQPGAGGASASGGCGGAPA